jgi:prepilin-type N-terminal cleavage/methylation domain-containing protein
MSSYARTCGRRARRNLENGFSLIELLIVIAIILIIITYERE